MIKIEDLLVRFEGLLLKEAGGKESVRNVISRAIGVDIKSEDIKIKNNTVYLNIKPIYKNEIFLKQDLILLELEKIFGKKTPTALL